jgi:hypothetical protein
MSVNQNQISSWNGYEVFGNRTTLSALMLSSNVINLVNEGVFRKILCLSKNILNTVVSRKLNPLSAKSIFIKELLRNAKLSSLFKRFPILRRCSALSDGNLLNVSLTISLTGFLSKIRYCSLSKIGKFGFEW